MTRAELNEYLEFAKSLAKEAGDIMLRYFRADDIGTEWKEDDTPITVADQMINDLVIERVRKAYPEHGVIGEEGSFHEDKSFVWVVDPIDGTSPFSHDIPVSCFSLALVDRSDGQPLVAVTNDPFQERLYSATAGGGSYLGDRKISSSNDTRAHRSFMSVGMGMPGQDSYSTAAATASLRDKGVSVVYIASHVYFANLVAEGKIQARFMPYGSPWDSAAVALLVQEAGGVVTDVYGKKRRYDEFADGCILSANEAIHKLVLEAIKDSPLK